jgi:hypothetical protein
MMRKIFNSVSLTLCFCIGGLLVSSVVGQQYYGQSVYNSPGQIIYSQPAQPIQYGTYESVPTPYYSTPVVNSVPAQQVYYPASSTPVYDSTPVFQDTVVQGTIVNTPTVYPSTSGYSTPATNYSAAGTYASETYPVNQSYEPSQTQTYTSATAHPVYTQPIAQPVYAQPSYSQPTYSQPTYTQPSYSQSYPQATYAQNSYPQAVSTSYGSGNAYASTSNGLAQQKAQQAAQGGVRGHLGGGLGNAKYEGVGWSNVSPQHAIQNCCYWGTRPTAEIGVSKGADGCWYACVLYN